MFKIYKIGDLGEQTIRGIVEIKEKIDFFPVYQRYGSIWDSYKQKLLIDTILNGYDIPKFYFNYFIEPDNPLNKNNKIYAVIDGKQRLQTIIDFVENKFPLDKEFEYYDDESIDLKSLYYSEIANKYPEVISKFYERTLDIVFVSTDDEERLEELFLRLNGGEALTNAEKRNAIGGYLNEEVRSIVESNMFFLEKVRFKNPRYQHQDLLTKLLYIENNGDLVSLTNSALNNFVRNNKSKNDLIEDIIQRVVTGLSDLSNTFNDKDSLLRGKGIIPVYYYYITRYNPDKQRFRSFLIDFENLRQENKKLDDNLTNPTLVEFDRLNQQAVHTQKSLSRRLEIIQKLYDSYVNYDSLKNNLFELPEFDFESDFEETT